VRAETILKSVCGELHRSTFFEQMLSIYIYAIPANGLRIDRKFSKAGKFAGNPLILKAKVRTMDLSTQLLKRRDGYWLELAPPAPTNTFPPIIERIPIFHIHYSLLKE
jgi:hypothetical protein